MASHSFNDLICHYGHKIEVVIYGASDDAERAHNVAIECRHCNEVLLDFDHYNEDGDDIGDEYI